MAAMVSPRGRYGARGMSRQTVLLLCLTCVICTALVTFMSTNAARLGRSNYAREITVTRVDAPIPDAAVVDGSRQHVEEPMAAAIIPSPKPAPSPKQTSGGRGKKRKWGKLGGGGQHSTSSRREGSKQTMSEVDRIHDRIREDFKVGAADSGCTLPQDFAALEHIKPMRIFFAADLHNNEHVIAHWLAEFLKLVLQLPKENVFVSVYDSASTDTTPTWVRMLNSVLSLQEVPHQVVTDAGYGRKRGQHRIDFMAKIRNKALEPLGVFSGYEHNLMHYYGHDKDARKIPIIPSIPSPALGGGGPGGNMTFDRIVFLNDVYFCMRDVIQLLLHDADMACGLDYDLFIGNRVKVSGQPQFYDTWVARDMEGRRLNKPPPHFTAKEDIDKLNGGEPIQVQCCWNGIAALNADPFHKGIRFRHVVSDDECKASECSHICDDMWANGYGRIVMDPLVKLGYKFNEWRSAVDRGHPQGRGVDLGGKGNAGPERQASFSRPLPKQTTCCSMTRNTDDLGIVCKEYAQSDVLKYSPKVTLKSNGRENPHD